MSIKDILEKFQTAMGAVAFAEVGEHETARQYLRQHKNANKKVLLVMDGKEEDFNKVLKHTWDLSQRMNGQLEILYLQDKEKLSTAESDRMEAVAYNNEITAVYSPLEVQQSVENKLVDYTQARRDILCVVLGLVHAETTQAKQKRTSEPLTWLMERLNCPIVILSCSS